MCNISVQRRSEVEQRTTSCTTGCFLFIGGLRTNLVCITTVHGTDLTNVKPAREKQGGTGARYEAVEPGVNAPLMSPNQRRLTSASHCVPQSHFLMLLLAVCHYALFTPSVSPSDSCSGINNCLVLICKACHPSVSGMHTCIPATSR